MPASSVLQTGGSNMHYSTWLGIAVAATLAAPGAAEAERTLRRFGVMLPLSGPALPNGVEEMAIIDYRLAQLNAMGGDRYEAVYADDRCNIPPIPGDADYEGRFATADKAYKTLTAEVDFILGTV